MNCKQ